MSTDDFEQNTVAKHEGETPRTDAVCNTPLTGESCTTDKWYKLQKLSRQLEREADIAIALLRAWVAGCGDEHFSTKDQCRDLLLRSGDFLASLRK